MINEIIKESYGLTEFDIKLLDSHFGTGVYLLSDGDGENFIVKTTPLYMNLRETEGEITDYLYKKGIPVARMIKNLSGNYITATPDYFVTMQNYIAGKTFAANSAPDSVMKKSAATLGMINAALRDYPTLPTRFGSDFFSPETAKNKCRDYKRQLEAAEDKRIIPLYREQIRHLDAISGFNIDTDRLTYSNSHGDYHIGQIIADADTDGITVIDWSSACRLPVCLDIMTFYSLSSPACRGGKIDVSGLRDFIVTYREYFPLSDYDIKTMPYVLYFWNTICNYSPSDLLDIPDSYKDIAVQIQNMLNYLYDNIEKLSTQLHALL